MARSETETVITWTADDDRATVYSLMPKVRRWCERAGGEEIREGTFLVPVGAISIRKPAPKRQKLTGAELEAARARARRARLAKTLSSGARSEERTGSDLG